MPSQSRTVLDRNPWQVSEFSLLACINCAILTGELLLDEGSYWRLKRAETDPEKDVDPDFVLISEDGISIRAAPSPIELGIRADCLVDWGDDNCRYYLVP